MVDLASIGVLKKVEVAVCGLRRINLNNYLYMQYIRYSFMLQWKIKIGIKFDL